MRIREYGIGIGSMPTGKLNKITDVAGVRVGHCTIADEKHNTGVTVVLPSENNPFVHKLPCASFVLNGYGKTAGLIQIDELGTLETPIALTNTLNVGLVHDALTQYMIDICAKDKISLRSVNPVVCECNDASLNDIRDRTVTAEHVFKAIDAAADDFEEGAVGCGRGTSCHGLKGGVGSASRIVEIDGKRYTLGTLVQTNHGRLEDLMIGGKNIGRLIDRELRSSEPDKGSCIIILATDAPLSDRQLRRVIKRCSVGLARLGSFIGHGSGEVFIGFSTANSVSPDYDKRGTLTVELLNERYIDLFFRAAAEAAEESVLNSMVCAEAVRKGKVARRSLAEFLTRCSEWN